MATGKDDLEMWARVSEELAGALFENAEHAAKSSPGAGAFLHAVSGLVSAGADTLRAIIRIDDEEHSDDGA